MKIKSIKKIKKENVYDLEITDNHNFFANGICVHNCVRGLMKKLGKADKKKEDLDAWDNIIERFEVEAVKHGLTHREAKTIADDMLQMSSYSFNKSHAVAYTYIAVMSLYMTHYFRKYFYSSILQYETEKENNLLSVLRTTTKKGYRIVPPEINTSKEKISPKGNKIYYGLSNIKQVGEKAVNVILENRAYDNFFDFLRTAKENGRIINKKVISALIYAGAFDEIERDLNTKQLISAYEKYNEDKKSIKVDEKLEIIWNEAVNNIKNIPGLKFSMEEKRENEKKYFGVNFFTSAFPEKLLKVFNDYYSKGILKESFYDITESSMKIPVYISGMRIFNDRNGNEMAFITAEDTTGVEEKIPIFQNLWGVLKDIFKGGSIFLLNLYKNDEEQIMFGRKEWTRSEKVMKNFVKKVM